MRSDVKHIIMFVFIVAIIGMLAFTLQSSDLNNISQIKISGNRLLNENIYLDYAQLNKIDENNELPISLIRDRLDKHPYIENVDVLVVERGIAEIRIFEKKIDAILLGENKQFLISEKAEVIPFIPTTKNIDLPVIVINNDNIKLFGNACTDVRLFSALKIITTAKLYDSNLYESISEINLSNKNNISVFFAEVDSPVYFGLKNEIEKTVYLSKIYKQIKGSQISDYINYVDLRYKDFVYLGLDEQLTKDEGKI